MKLKELTSHLLIIYTLVKLSLSRSLWKTLPDNFNGYMDQKAHYNPEENLGSTMFLAEGDILIDKDLYYSMLGLESPESSRTGIPGSEQDTETTTTNPQPQDGEFRSSSHRFRSGQRQKRSINSSYHLMWMNRSVPYEFDVNFGQSQRAMVIKAMHLLESLSCIRFTERRNEVDYVHIMVPDQAICYSTVGRHGGRQDIGLSLECNFGTAIHELLHALGFWHEHNRKDRDEYITVIWDNIKDDKRINFNISKGPSVQDIFLQKPYDYGSIMHYANNTFSKNGRQATLQPNKPLEAGVQLGQRKWPSRLDVDKLNALYMCEIRDCSQPTRPENGYVIGHSYNVGSKVSYGCMMGYVLIGAPERFCLTIGQWSGDQPSCLPNTSRDPVYYCNYDQPYHSLCGWIQAKDDGRDWTFNSGGTLSEHTGPYWDNTLNTESGVYLYIEASTKSTKNQARLISPIYEGNGYSNLCFIFFTYMYGQLMGSLSVYKQVEEIVNNVSATKTEFLYSINGDQGSEWKQIFLNLGTISGPFNIILEGTVGGWASDIAIDDLIVGSCKDLGPIAASGGLQSEIECSFDNGGICDLIQDTNDQTNWLVKRGQTRTFNTGPACDPINCSTGRYLYLEASGLGPGDTAILKTPTLRGQGQSCVSFYYHMYGRNIGGLNVEMHSRTSGHWTPLWSETGNQGNRWYQKFLEFTATDLYEIRIKGVRGGGIKSDIAIDNIKIMSGPCSGLLSFNCSFERDMCGWTNVPSPGDQQDWNRHYGETDTPYTGPMADRTNPVGHFVYVESSRTLAYDTARMMSPEIRQTSSGYCLEFWYHMYGQTTGNLTVVLQSEIGMEYPAWSKRGDQGNMWHYQAVHLTSFPQQSIRVIFQVRLKGDTGDTAIDDVAIHPGHCDNTNVGRT